MRRCTRPIRSSLIQALIFPRQLTADLQDGAVYGGYRFAAVTLRLGEEASAYGAVAVATRHRKRGRPKRWRLAVSGRLSRGTIVLLA